MRETNRQTAHDHPIWVALRHYSIGPEASALTFADRLARENGWSAEKAGRVVDEYRRFCFLAATAGHEVTPSDAVDQAWHLHLTYSRDYWERFCPEVLGGPLHHGPTAGGTAEQHRFYEQYAETLKSYEEAFGESAPADQAPAVERLVGSKPGASTPRRLHRQPEARRRILLLLGVAFILFIIIRTEGF
jgi:hypothetical protein